MNAFDALATWKLRAMLAAVVVAILAGVLLWGRHDAVAGERRRMAPVIASYELRIQVLLGKLRAADDALATANAAVNQLKLDADARERAARAALQAAKTQADRYRLRASQIAAARPTGDQCVASRDLIINNIGEERK